MEERDECDDLEGLVGKQKGENIPNICLSGLREAADGTNNKTAFWGCNSLEGKLSNEGEGGWMQT